MNRTKPYIRDTVFMLLGTFTLALGVNMFLVPAKLSSGGITTVGTILYYIFNIRMSITNLLFNAVLFVMGFKYLGKYALIKTAQGIIFYSLFLEITSYLPQFSGDLTIASVSGGVFVGLGVGLIIRRDGSTGGSDFAALIIKRFIPHVPVATILLILDSTIIVVSGIIFKSFTVTIYSIIAMYISSKVADGIVTIGDKAKSIQIFSHKVDEISSKILNELDRGVTGIHCKGMYSQTEGMMLLCLVTPKELPSILDMVRSIDPTAFIVIQDAREVLGEGFKEKTPYYEKSNKKKRIKERKTIYYGKYHV